MSDRDRPQRLFFVLLLAEAFLLELLFFADDERLFAVALAMEWWREEA